MSYLELNLDLDDADIAVRDAAHRFAAEVVRPVGTALDRLPADAVVAPDSPLWGFLAQAYELGYHKAMLPEAVGGLGFTPLQGHLLMEELCWGNGGLAAVLLLAAWPYVKLLHSGSPDLIERFVTPFCDCSDGTVTGAWAITEPDHGSDTLNVGGEGWTNPAIRLQLSARADGDEWVLNGQKSAWVSCGPSASHAMVNVQIDPSRGPAGGGVCMLPLNLPGVSRGRPLDKHGVRDLPQGEIFFDEVRIPRTWMFVGPDHYGDWICANLGFGNTAVAVLAVGMARAAFEEALSYTRARRQGGKPLIEHHAVQVRIHRLFSRVEALRAFTRAVWNVNARIFPPLTEYAYAAKTYATETAKEVVDEAVQLHGACGVSREYYVEKLWRDVRTMTIADGENSILNRVGGQIVGETFPRAGISVAP